MYKSVVGAYHRNAKVLLTDYRDAVVQRDPFGMPSTLEAWSSGYTLLLSGEPASMAIGVGSHITQWLTACFGKAFVKAHHASPNLCSGTTMGTAAAISINLRLMIELTLFKEADDEKHKAEFRKPGEAGVLDTDKREHCSTLQGVDQGFFNFLYYSGAYDKESGVTPKVFPVGTGPMFTMGELATQFRAKWLKENPPGTPAYSDPQYYMDPKNPNLWLPPNNGIIETDKDGFILLNDGEPRSRAAVVHQLDRFGHRGYHPFMSLMQHGPLDKALYDGTQQLDAPDPARCAGCLAHHIAGCRFSATRNRCEGA